MAKTCSYANCDRGCYGEFCILHKPRKPLKQRKPIKKIGKRGKKNQETTKAWQAQNTEFICYLRISPMCLVYLDEQTAVPEHVIPKGKGQEQAHNLKNIRAACTFCNALKGSRSLENLAKIYPHLLALTQKHNRATM